MKEKFKKRVKIAWRYFKIFAVGLLCLTGALQIYFMIEARGF